MVTIAIIAIIVGAGIADAVVQGRDPNPGVDAWPPTDPPHRAPLA
jgi:hypothetical protein